MAKSFSSALTVTWLYKRVIYLVQFLTVLQIFLNFRRKIYLVNASKDAIHVPAVLRPSFAVTPVCVYTSDLRLLEIEMC